MTMTISVWHGGGMHSAKCSLVFLMEIICIRMLQNVDGIYVQLTDEDDKRFRTDTEVVLLLP